MPVSGITTCGAYHGCGRTISSATIEIMMSMVTTRLSSTIGTSPFGTPFARDIVICTAAMSMTAMSPTTSHTFCWRITYSSTMPMISSCTNERTIDQMSDFATPSFMSTEMPAAMTTMPAAMSRPMLSIVK